MRSINKNRTLLDIGFAALPIFCSLLGAVLMITLNLRQTGSQPLSRESMKQLQSELQRVRRVTDVVLSSYLLVSNRISLAECQLSLCILDRKLTEARQEKERLEAHVNQAMLLSGRLTETKSQVAAIHGEVVQAQVRVKKLLSQVQPGESNAITGLLGGYHGPLVFVECKADGVVVYPGGRKLAASAPVWEMAWLFDAIELAGFVALAARPDSFEECYPRMRKLIYQRVEESNQKRLQKIGRCSFPIPATAPIEQYLPKGNMS